MNKRFYLAEAGKEIQQYCSQISEGMSAADAKKMAGQKYPQFASPGPADENGVFTAPARGFGYGAIFYCGGDHDGQDIIGAKMR